MRTRRQKRIMKCINDNCIDMIQRYDGVYTPCWESNFEYFVNKMYFKFRNMFKRQYNYIVTNKKLNHIKLRIMTKEEIIDCIKNVSLTTARNSMGCSENWYNSYYAIKETFSMEEIENMSESELNNLVKLGDAISDGLY